MEQNSGTNAVEKKSCSWNWHFDILLKLFLNTIELQGEMSVVINISDSFALDEPSGCEVNIKSRRNHFGEGNQTWNWLDNNWFGGWREDNISFIVETLSFFTNTKLLCTMLSLSIAFTLRTNFCKNCLRKHVFQSF